MHLTKELLIEFISDGEDISCDWEADGYRLPTEAEWQYACKAETTEYRYGESGNVGVKFCLLISTAL